MSNSLRIVLFGDGVWAANSLRSLVEAGHRVAGVVVRVQPSSPVLEETARVMEYPVLQPADASVPQFVEALDTLSPDLCLSISYNQIVRRPVLDVARLGLINFHAGKLPFYRGRNVINWAIINGETEIGLTAHYADEGIDTGDIVLQRVLPIHWTDTYGDVLNRVVDAFPEFVCETVRLVAEGRAERVSQSHLLGTYFGGRGEGDEWLDWADTSFNLHNKVRAITRPGPGARTLLGEREARIWSAYFDPAWPKYIATPGQIVGRRPDGVLVKTGDSTLFVTEVQLEGGECETPQWRIGTRLGINLAAYVRDLRTRLAALEQQRKEHDEPR